MKYFSLLFIVCLFSFCDDSIDCRESYSIDQAYITKHYPDIEILMSGKYEITSRGIQDTVIIEKFTIDEGICTFSNPRYMADGCANCRNDQLNYEYKKIKYQNKDSTYAYTIDIIGQEYGTKLYLHTDNVVVNFSESTELHKHSYSNKSFANNNFPQFNSLGQTEYKYNSDVIRIVNTYQQGIDSIILYANTDNLTIWRKL